MAEQVFEIGGVLRRYDWGSRDLIPHLLGEEPDGRPAAELWFGAHPGDPSPALGTTLDAVLAESGEPPLPFLVKILAARTALSIQVHPNRAQAQAGYEREEAAGIPRDSAERNYVDRNHKPELLCALTPFEALCGFRPVAGTLSLLDELAIAELGFVSDLLRGADPLRSAFTAVLTHDDPGRLIRPLVARSGADERLRGVALAAEHFPDDIGVVLALLLNHVRLEPGQAIFLGAGNVHCYLRGMGVEVMASSDNVLRCGLTSKHVDVDELLAITDFSELPDPVWPRRSGRFELPVPDFTLQPVDLDGSLPVDGAGPHIVLVTGGCARVEDVELRPGHAALARPGAHPQVRGTAQLFVVGTELADGEPGQGAQGEGVSFAPK